MLVVLIKIKDEKSENVQQQQQDHVTAGAASLPEEQHKAIDKRSEIVLAINFSRGTKCNCAKHLSS